MLINNDLFYYLLSYDTLNSPKKVFVSSKSIYLSLSKPFIESISLELKYIRPAV